MPDARIPLSKSSLQSLFSDTGDKKIVLVGPGNQKLQDSRFAIADAGVDHVIVKLLGEDQLVIPYASITSIKLERIQLTINYR